MEIVEFGPLSAEVRAELEGDEIDPFGDTGLPIKFRGKDFHVALRDPGARLVASTGMVLVDVDVDVDKHERVPVVGLGGVLVNAEYRGRGLGREVVQAALARAQTVGRDFALLFCLSDRAGFYERLGFAVIPSPVSVEQPDGIAEMPLHAMWYPLAEGAVWPAGPVHLRSMPF